MLLRPAGDGTGVIAGGGVRAVVELAGVRNVLTKCIGSHNPHNMVKATIAALQQLRTPEQVATRRGKTVGGADAREDAAMAEAQDAQGDADRAARSGSTAAPARRRCAGSASRGVGKTVVVRDDAADAGA